MRGVSFTWPSYAPGAFDNVRASGQTIALSGAGSELGFPAVVPLDAGKTVASVTLPEDFDMHIFAIAVGGLFPSSV